MATAATCCWALPLCRGIKSREGADRRCGWGSAGARSLRATQRGATGSPGRTLSRERARSGPAGGLRAPHPVWASHLSCKGSIHSPQPSQALPPQPPQARSKPLLRPSTGQQVQQGLSGEAGARPRAATMLELALEGPRRPRGEVKQEASSWPTTGRALGGPVGGWFRSPPHLGLLPAAQALAQPCDLLPGRWEEGCLSDMFSCLPFWDPHSLLLCPPESEFSSPQLPSPLPGAGPPGSRGPNWVPWASQPKASPCRRPQPLPPGCQLQGKAAQLGALA